MGNPGLEDLIPDIVALKERNHLLEKTLANIASVLGTPSLYTTEPEKKKKKKKKKKTTKKDKKSGFAWCGKEGTFDAYRCNECLAIIRGDKIEKHRCMPYNKKRKSPDKKRKEPDSMKKRRMVTEPKSFDGFTLATTAALTSTSYPQCNRCSYTIDENNPKYSGHIEGWTWTEYRNNFSCYRCDSCYIVMRYDFIDRHKCSRNQEITTIRMEPNEYDIVL